MKKIFYNFIYLLLFAFILSSCEKDEIGGTATEEMAGEWYVTVVAVDADDNVLYEDEDLYGMGYIHLDTYNTSSNSTSEMWIDDNENFWEFKNKVNIDLKNLTFEIDSADNEYYDMKVHIENGRILKGAATTPSGSVADSIVFNITFDDDGYIAAGYWHAYRIAGYRYTGLTNDD